MEGFRDWSRCLKVIVAGLAKTGTTGLFYQIRNSLEGEARILFEQTEYERRSGDDEKLVLAKTLIGREGYADFSSFDPFHKKVCIVRDPRDRAISSILYRSFDEGFLENDESVERLVSLLKKKEQAPDEVSLVDLVMLQGELAGNPPKKPAGAAYPLITPLEWLMEFRRDHPEYFIVKYEDFVENRLDGLAEYLGFPLVGESEVEPHVQRVVRTKKAGDWKNWFTESDVALLRADSRMAEYMDTFGYEDDWGLPEERTVDPRHGSEYVLRLVKERRGGLSARLRRLLPA